MERKIQSRAEDILSIQQIASYLLAVRMNKMDIDLLDRYVFKSEANPNGMPNVSFHRLQNICSAVNAGNDIWEEDDPYHFLADPSIQDDNLIKLMIRFVDSPKMEILKSGVLSPEQISAIAEGVKKAEKQGKSPLFAEWLIDPRMTPQNILDAAQLAQQIPHSAMDIVLQYADLDQFRQAGYCDGREDATGVSCLIDAYKNIPAAYRSFAWTDVFSPASCRIPGYCAAFFRAIRLGFPQFFTEYPDFPEAAMELLRWAEEGFTDGANVLHELQKVRTAAGSEFVDPIKIMAAYRRFRVSAEEKELRYTPENLYRYFDAEMIDKMTQHYDEKGAAPLPSTMQRISEKDAGTEKYYQILLFQFDHEKKQAVLNIKNTYEFNFSGCDFQEWNPQHVTALKSAVSLIRVLQNYPISQDTSRLDVRMDAIYNYIQPETINEELETELFFAAGELHRTEVLISVRVKSQTEMKPDIVIYC